MPEYKKPNEKSSRDVGVPISGSPNGDGLDDDNYERGLGVDHSVRGGGGYKEIFRRVRASTKGRNPGIAVRKEIAPHILNETQVQLAKTDIERAFDDLPDNFGYRGATREKVRLKIVGGVDIHKAARTLSPVDTIDKDEQMVFKEYRTRVGYAVEGGVDMGGVEIQSDDNTADPRRACREAMWRTRATLKALGLEARRLLNENDPRRIEIINSLRHLGLDGMVDNLDNEHTSELLHVLAEKENILAYRTAESIIAYEEGCSRYILEKD